MARHGFIHGLILIDYVNYYCYFLPVDEPNGLIAEVRGFNRFYTRIIGLLDRRFLRSPFSLTEVRVLYELAHSADKTAKSIQGATGIDSGYLSRMLQRFLRAGLARRRRHEGDGRFQVLELTELGRETIEGLEREQEKAVSDMVGRLSPSESEELAGHMRRIEEILRGHEEAQGRDV